MHMLAVIAGSLGLVFGSILTAVLICWTLWRLFRLIGHPEFSAAVTLLAIPLAIALSTSQFIRMTAIFAIVVVVPLWVVGREWRLRHA